MSSLFSAGAHQLTGGHDAGALPAVPDVTVSLLSLLTSTRLPTPVVTLPALFITGDPASGSLTGSPSAATYEGAPEDG